MNLPDQEHQKWEQGASRDGERESVDSDFRNSLNFSAYCRNEIKWLCVQTPRKYLFPIGMPPHNLRLNIGSLVILLRNLNSSRLCNYTRLALKRITINLLEATILIALRRNHPVVFQLHRQNIQYHSKGFDFLFVRLLRYP
ncbi:hypothetical protein TNCV_1769481 [Trichonephila clavipes]|nr:hypothetical protein TNCV_1769481 [Trichonephila clavipes]